MKGFRSVLLRGNVLDLAAAVVIVAAFVKDPITPLLAAIGGKPDCSAPFFTITTSEFLYGDFIDALIAFAFIAPVFIAFVISYPVVLPMKGLIARSREEPPPDPPTRTCPQCLSGIALEPAPASAGA